ncbi:uncharacterized protein LOC134271023 isoform X1 [Saccostrea cucullata]|uniref:uncharacterized protein LOC134271023 isoform X1 n=1 Tax=Saccostrea cuccullata TaxID=36930 RepID=UPI002ED1F111
MCSKSAAFYFCLTCLLAPSLLLQATGFYSPYWIKHNSTSDCFRGIILSVNCNETIEAGLGTTAICLEITAFLIIALTTGVIMYSICCNKDGLYNAGCCTKCGVGVLCLYPAAGIIGFAGCMLVASNYRDHEKGWSFYISLAASCYVMLLSLVFCCAIYRYAKKEKGTYNKDGNVNRSYVGNEVAQYDESRGSQDNSAMASSGDGGLVFSHVHEEYNVEISNRGSIMISTLQIARMFHMK